MPRNNRRDNGTMTWRQRQDEIYRQVSLRMTEELRHGHIPWHEAWADGAAVSHATGRPYSLLNQMLLGRSGEYLTFNMAAAEGGHVRQGERASSIVFWKQLRLPVERHAQETAPEATSEDDDEAFRIIPFLKEIKVFHIDQTEGVERRHHTSRADLAGGMDAEAIAAAFFAREGAPRLETGEGLRPAYSPARDTITMPPRSSYADEEAYWGALFHQMAHATAAEGRCGRITSNAQWFDHDAFGREELVAEMTAAMLAAHAGLSFCRCLHRNADYIRGWMEAIGQDERLVVTAAGRADKATALILGKADEADETMAA